MLQNEVVNRITAKTGNSERGFLTVLVEAYFKSEKLFDVPPGAFYPKPKIWSSVIKLVPRKSKIRNESLYREIVGLSFTQKRKTIKNNLKNAKGDLRAAIEKKGGLSKILEETEIEPTRRAESISIREWILLTDFIDAKIDKNGD
jgi:16S rRNA (adenine1518-N6/adenine1519-N6)-dimethyltransferase